MQLYECTKLHAKISLAQCAANRARPADVILTSDINHTPLTMPTACKNCTDYLAWSDELSMSIKQTGKQEIAPIKPVEVKAHKQTKLCAKCNKDISYDKKRCKGLCESCYKKEYRKLKLNNSIQVKSKKNQPVQQVQLFAPPAKHIYLATPYSNPDPCVRLKRYKLVNLVAGTLMLQGDIVFSPVSMGHGIAEDTPSLPYEFEFWQKQCLSYLKTWATHLYVVQVEGLEQSHGVKAEIAQANKINLPVIYVLPIEINK